MAATGVPHFHNSEGLAQIEIGAREFKCVGAEPPFDHPHVYLDMGADNEIVCPYCSTHYIFNSKLGSGMAEPATAIFQPTAA